MTFLKLLDKLFARIFYSEYTVARYFRKQGAKIGDNNRIFIRYLGSEPYLIKIGNKCTICSGVAFFTHDGGVCVFREDIPNINVYGKIEIEDNCFIGAGSIILHDVKIGPNSVVGAGAVVTKNVPPNTVVAGVPAKVICSIDEYRAKSTERFRTMGLHGDRITWRKQLESYFWQDKE